MTWLGPTPGIRKKIARQLRARYTCETGLEPKSDCAAFQVWLQERYITLVPLTSSPRLKPGGGCQNSIISQHLLIGLVDIELHRPNCSALRTVVSRPSISLARKSRNLGFARVRCCTSTGRKRFISWAKALLSHLGGPQAQRHLGIGRIVFSTAEEIGQGLALEQAQLHQA